jgi:uncharacterized protein YgiM (DUF1202 family)
MTRSIQRLTALMAVLLLVVLSAVQVSAQSTGRARFVHVTPSVGAVDIYVNGSLLAQGVEYGSASPLFTLPTGDHIVDLTLANQTNSLIQQSITIDALRPTAFVVADGTQFFGVPENLNETPTGGARLLLVHALAGGPAVDVKLAEAVMLGGVEQPVGTPLATNMAYSTTFGAFDVPAQTYVVDVFAAGTDTEVLSDLALPLAAGTSYSVIVYGTPSQPQTLLLTAPTQGASGTGLVRVIHAVIGGPAVDIYDGSTLIIPSLAPEKATEHIALPAGTRTLIVRAAGAPADETSVLAQADVTVAAGSASTVVAMEATGAVVLGIYADDVSQALDGQRAAVSVVNTIAESVVETFSIADFPIATDISYAMMSDAATVTPVAGNADFTLNVNNQRGVLRSPLPPLYGGVYYNVVVVSGTLFSGPRALAFPTVLNATTGSAPNANQSLAAALPQPTTEPVTAPTQAPPAVTEAPPQVVVTQPSAVDPNQITARVVLDPGANLQLRQNPSPDALSLGLAPAGSVLIVNGREGRPVALVEGQAPPPEAETYEDPVGLLPDDRADLPATATWLNVTYNTPDGGRITAWVLAQFLDVRNARNERVRLRDLEPIARNIPGRAVETVVTPPPVPTDVLQAVVFNLDPGVSLNIRRLPTTEGEVLARVQAGTVLEFLGGEEEERWAFIRYTTPEGGTVEGWVSTQYIQYQYNNRTFRLEEFKNLVSRTTSQALYELIPTDTLGSVRGPAPTLVAPTVDPFRDQYVATVRLDPSANLQFRRNPDPASESLGLIPSGTQVIVTARTEAGDWLRAEFQGQTGWISANFVTITFNRASVSVNDIPVDTTLP